MKKKLLVSLLALAVMVGSAMSLAACGEKKTNTAWAYGTISNNGYFVAASVTVEGKDIVDADIEEVMMPQEWAKWNANVEVEETPPTETIDNYVSYPYKTYSGSAVGYVAKYIKVGDDFYKTVLDTTVADNNKPTFMPCNDKGELTSGGKDLIAELGSNAAVQADYYNLAVNKPISFQLMKIGAGDKLVKFDTGLRSYYGLLKSSNNYWPDESKEAGISRWQWNVNKTIAHIVENGIPTAEDIADHKNEGKAISDLLSGATWTAYDQYLTVLRTAYEAAIA